MGAHLVPRDGLRPHRPLKGVRSPIFSGQGQPDFCLCLVFKILSGFKALDSALADDV